MYFPLSTSSRCSKFPNEIQGNLTTATGAEWNIKITDFAIEDVITPNCQERRGEESRKERATIIVRRRFTETNGELAERREPALVREYIYFYAITIVGRGKLNRRNEVEETCKRKGNFSNSKTVIISRRKCWEDDAPNTFPARRRWLMNPLIAFQPTVMNEYWRGRWIDGWMEMGADVYRILEDRTFQLALNARSSWK